MLRWRVWQRCIANARETPAVLFGAAAAGLAFALYLTYIEGHVLGVWCILCLSSLALITATTVLSGIIWWRSRSR